MTRTATKKHFARIIALLTVCFLTTLPLAASNPTGNITYILSTDNSTTQEGKDAYARIKIAMDSALYYYNTYTSITKKIVARFDPAVGTAEANFDGRISFGKNKAYQVTCTAMHEVAHTIGVGTTSEWGRLMVNGVFTGKNATRKIQEIYNSPDSIVHGDTNRDRLWHFWPFGLNYASEVKSKQDLINHCLMVDAICKDLFPTGAVNDRLVVLAHTGPEITADETGLRFTIGLPSQGRIDAALFSFSGRRVATFTNTFGVAGTYTFALDNASIPPGRYLYRVIAGATIAEGISSIVR